MSGKKNLKSGKSKRKERSSNTVLVLGWLLLGITIILAGLAFIYDLWWSCKDWQAGEASRLILKELLRDEEDRNYTYRLYSMDECETVIKSTENHNEAPGALEEQTTADSVCDWLPKEMSYKEVDGIKYLGVLQIPELSLELPVIFLDEWDAAYMDYAPCTYDGTLAARNLIIMAHNYVNHFRPILNMIPGQTVILTTADGYVYTYITTAVDTMHRSEREKLYQGTWDLTLFTCIPDTYNRCAVRCSLISAAVPEI